MEKTLELICEALSNKKGVLIKVLNVKDLTSIADYFIISSVMNKSRPRHQRMKWKKNWKKPESKPFAKRVIGKGNGFLWILEMLLFIYLLVKSVSIMTLIHFGRMHFQRIIRKIKMINKMITPEINVPALKENSIVELPVSRIVSFGAFLSAQTGNNADDILLHNGQQTSEIKEGDIVKVFLYHDPRHRLTASMRLPKLEIGEVGYTEVILTTRFGAFVDVGTERGIFLPYSEMIEPVQKGQKIWIKLYEDKTGRLAVTTHVEEDIRCLARPCKELNVDDKITGTVYNITRQGIFIITRERWIGFLHNSNINTVIKLGQELIGRITFIREDGHVNISLRQTKEREMNHDMAVLIDCMNQHNGLLPYTDKSDSKLIKLNLRMSKSAFKRAVGHLLKTNQIIMSEGKIQLKR